MRSSRPAQPRTGRYCRKTHGPDSLILRGIIVHTQAVVAIFNATYVRYSLRERDQRTLRMQFTEIELTNWGPFFGTHRIDLSVPDTAPVVLIHGENMRGKTSLLRGMIWCLYSEIREQDGRTSLDVSRMVNIDALEEGDTQFGVRLKFVHKGTTFSLYRTAVAREDRPGRVTVSRQDVDLIADGASPYPVGQIPEVIGGILSRDISDFFLFDGEMLNRFEERLREERASAQGFVRAQVEKALGLPFLKHLSRDLETILAEVDASFDQALRRSRAQSKLSDEYGANVEALTSVERNIAGLKSRGADLDAEIDGIEAELSKVDEIKEAFYERRALEREIDSSQSLIADYRSAMADRTESTWWLPAAELLHRQLGEVEQQIIAAERSEHERIRTEVRVQNLRDQLNSRVCPTCNQPVELHNEAAMRAELDSLLQTPESMVATTLDELRSQRDRLRKFSNAPGVVSWFHDQERDIRRETLKKEKREQRVRDISDQLAGSTVAIDALEKNLLDRKATRAEIASALEQLSARRLQLRQEGQKLSAKLASQPEVDPAERRLREAASEALDTVDRSFDVFRTSMRSRVEQATSELFRRLTTEKDYSGVAISSDYLLTVTDQQGRPLSMISAGANQILTMAFIGALAQSSVDEAPMVMDTPFGRLDLGHRRAVLDWVSTFDRQVIMFVQSGEYDASRDAEVLSGKIGREYTIARLTPNRSEVR